MRSSCSDDTTGPISGLSGPGPIFTVFRWATKRSTNWSATLRGDYYKGVAAKRAAKKLKAANMPKASKTPKAPAKVSRKRSPAAKPALG